MKLGLCIGLFFLYLTSCKRILEQEWGPNLAQEATSLEPNLIDGNLVLGNYLLDKKKQTPLADDINWRNQFELD